ncbi:hypothetical protein COU57_00385 [Candidatus Pacearchaeota archaeon CG10_big_fil_rev_8_21_14_0_10_32_14]|nr:MAG: hypothetical protein COU57_00385 [Candidatus Pacearchaeota archaeon CG10_big_fil_rev_8_21_14_0_10_32_14]
MITIGFIVRQWSIKILGEFFTPSIKTQEHQKIIMKGPYKYIRHPSYTGLLLEVCGVSLCLSNWISFTFSFVFLFSALVYRINIEEKLLSKEFGEEYKNYTTKTKKLIPYIY